jgi:predicted TIM-barrel fold metal-dependent hydrolase
VATVEATADQLGAVAELRRELPDLRVVVDHFGWPTDLSADGRRAHLARLAEFAEDPGVATRIDAIGTVFGDWTVDAIRPWLLGVVDLFGPERCMLGSDLPIERLRSGFEHLYRAYGEIFAGHSQADRDLLMRGTAERWYGS